jgi:hypothetical protein
MENSKTAALTKEPRMIVRYNKPTKYDTVPAGIICKTLKDEEIPTWDSHSMEPLIPNSEFFDLYIQVSNKKDNPKWKTIGDFFQKIFGDVIYDEDLTTELMKLYHDDKHNSFLALAKILKKKIR